jgi:hypothetical protein
MDDVLWERAYGYRRVTMSHAPAAAPTIAQPHVSLRKANS